MCAHRPVGGCDRFSGPTGVSAADSLCLDPVSVIAHLRMACLHNFLHSSHFPGCEPDFDAARVEGGCREDVFHHAASKLPGTLIVLLRDVHPQPWLDVCAVLPVHALAS